MTDGDRVSRWLLARSLGLIAGALRGLTFDELVYALGLYTPPSKGGVSRTAKDLAELKRNLRKEINETWIRQLLRPFADLKPTVGFVHQSLKDAVLEFPPTTNAALSTVGGGIPGVMLRTCVDYLMLDDFNWPETVPDDEGNVPDMSQDHRKMWQDHQRKMWQDYHQKMSDKSKLIGIVIAGAEDERGSALRRNSLTGPPTEDEHVFAFRGNSLAGPPTEDEHGSAFNGNSLTEPPVSSNTDPFGAFFDYAAGYWINHLGRAPVDFRLDDVLELASHFSPRRRAWTLCFRGLRSDSRQPRSLEVYGNLTFASWKSVDVAAAAGSIGPER